METYMANLASNPEDEPRPHLISTDFYSLKGHKIEGLINNTSQASAVPGKNTWFSYTFKESVYLTEISVTCEGYESWNDFDFEVRHVDGTMHEQKINVQNGAVSLKLGKLCSGFRFRPESRAFFKPTIVSVQVSGYTLEEFHKFEWDLRELDKKQAELKSREERHQSIKVAIGELRAEQTNLESEIGKSRAESEQLKASIAEKIASESKLKRSLLDSEAKMESLEGNLRAAQTEIATLEKKRDEIVREIRLFPSEIAGFVREGDRNIRWYLMICVPFVLILVTIVTSMFSSAVDLTQIWKLDEGADVWTIFLTRIPFVLLAVAIIEVCGYIVGRLIFEIVRINRQRLDFSKLSIIAKDVSAASSSGLDMSDAEVFERETKLKMELLREHMKNYTGSEFEYKGSALVSAIAGVAERIVGKKEQA